jgi:hypothetical protein
VASGGIAHHRQDTSKFCYPRNIRPHIAVTRVSNNHHHAAQWLLCLHWVPVAAALKHAMPHVGLVVTDGAILMMAGGRCGLVEPGRQRIVVATKGMCPD